MLALAGCGGGSSAPPVAAESDYVGTGTANIGPVDLPAGADAEWTSSGGMFMLIALEPWPDDLANPQIIVSEAGSGEGYVPPGSYTFKVSTWSDSEWTLSFHER